MFLKRIKRLGDELERQWRARRYQPAAFASISHHCLEGFGPMTSADLDDLQAFLLLQKLPDECNPFGDNGPAAFTLVRRPGFVVNVYLYLRPDLFLHDHDFYGAFVNLAGESFHTTYTFRKLESPSADVHFGSLALQSADLLTPGRVCSLQAGPELIHRVWHLSAPTIVLVPRTLPLPKLIQLQYSMPSMATGIVRPHSPGPAAPLGFRKQKKMHEFLSATDPVAAAGFQRQMILSADAWCAVHHLLEGWSELEETGRLQPLLEECRRSHGAWIEHLVEVSEAAGLHLAVDWSRLSGEGERLLMALLFTYSDRTPILNWVRSRYPHQDPVERVTTWLHRIMQTHVVDLPLDETATLLLDVMLEGHLGRQFLPALRRRFAVHPRESRAIAEVARELRKQPLLRPLLTPSDASSRN